MSQWIKRIFIISIIMSAVIITAPVYADQIIEINTDVMQPNFTYINIFRNSFDISGSGYVSIGVNFRAQNVDEVKVFTYLQQYNSARWQTVKNWSVEKQGTSCSIALSHYVINGYSYRLVSYGYTYKNGNLVESTSYISNPIKY